MKIGKSLIFWLAAIVLLTAIANMTGQGTPARSAGSELPFSEFMNQAENNRIAEVTVPARTYTELIPTAASFTLIRRMIRP